MTYKQLQDECIALRFNETYRASIKSWLNLRYTAIWNMADWYFRHVKGANLAIIANDNTPTMPSDFARSEGLFDNNGDPLTYLPPVEWREIYLSPYLNKATPSSSYTVVNREIYLGPTPSSNATYTLAYSRRLSHIDGPSGLAAAGVMSNDSDQPIWGAEFDYLLVVDVTILGQQMLQDPNWRTLESQRDELVASLKEDSLHGLQVNETMFWSGDYRR